MSERFSPAWLETHRVALAAPVTEADIVGIGHVMAEVRSLLARLANPEAMAAVGAEIPRGILFYGDPGTGKTLVARFLAASLGPDVPMYEISADELTPARIRGLARHLSGQRCVVYLDEIDYIARKRSWAGHSAETRGTLVAFLAALDGLTPAAGPVFVAASNETPFVLDEALMRAGRFGFRVRFDLPNFEERVALLTMFLARRPTEPDLDLKELAEAAGERTPAALRAAVDDATAMALADGRSATGQADLRQAIGRDGWVEPEPEEAPPPDPARLARCAVHEAGHVAAAVALSGLGSVERVVVSADGGHTAVAPVIDPGADAVRDAIAIALAGRAAEELFLGAATLRIRTDVSHATALATRLVKTGLWPGAQGLDPNELDDLGSPPADAIEKVLAALAEGEARARRIVAANLEPVRTFAAAVFESPEGRFEGEALRKELVRAGFFTADRPDSDRPDPVALLRAAVAHSPRNGAGAAPHVDMAAVDRLETGGNGVP